MTKSMRMIIGLAAGLILIAGGFAIGVYANKKTDSLLSEKEQLAVPEKARPSLNKNLYTVSPPSQGRAYASVPITFENLFGDQAVIILKADLVKDAKAGQNVLLYDEKDT